MVSLWLEQQGFVLTLGRWQAVLKKQGHLEVARVLLKMDHLLHREPELVAYFLLKAEALWVQLKAFLGKLA